MTAVFVYEYLCALGAGSDSTLLLAPSLLQEGCAMFDAVSADLRAAPGVRVLSARSDSETEFRELAARAQYSLIIAPEFDGILEARCRWVEEAGGRLLGPSSRAVRLCADKLELASHFEAAGVPTPRTFPFDRDPRDQFPRVWKPRHGAGSQDTFVLNRPDDVARAQADLDQSSAGFEMITQEYVAGLPASVAFLIGSDRPVALVPCAQRLSSDGRCHYLGGSLPVPNDLASRAIAVATRAVKSIRGLFGYVGVDVVLGHDVLHDRVIEINPRLTTSYLGLRRQARFNIAEAILSLATQVALAKLEWNSGSIEFGTVL